MSTRFFLTPGLRLTALMLVAGVCPAQNLTCAQPLSLERQRELLNYVRERYKLPDSITLELSTQTLVKDSCYRRLTFVGTSRARTWDLTLYLAPDLRFLTSEIFDTSVHPAAEQRATDQALVNGLAPGSAPVRGPDQAPVTIALFSDFQCPFCRRLAGYLDEVMSDGGKDVRVVFHYLPLRGHDWALSAAEAAACAQSQSNAAFWAIHDQIFRNQGSINSQNAKEKLAGLAGTVEGLDTKALLQCMDGSTSLGLVLRDISLAEALHVAATPTLFINGERAQGVQSASHLRELISRAREETPHSGMQ